MNQAELIARIAATTLQPKSVVENSLKLLGEIAQSALKDGDEVTLPGIGKLTVKAKAARTGRNPATGESIDIPAKRVPHFSAAKALKDAVA